MFTIIVLEYLFLFIYKDDYKPDLTLNAEIEWLIDLGENKSSFVCECPQ